MHSGETPLNESARTVRDSLREEAGLPVAAPVPPLPREQLAARRWAVSLGVAAVFFVFAYSVTWHTAQAPVYALVARDDAARVYLSPSCAIGRGNLPVSSLGAARQAGLAPDPACEKSGGFLGSSQTVMQELLSRMYLYPKRGTRWRPDGTWKW
jgi:hypothetical protein